MKIYTFEEKMTAKAQLPKPVSDFLSSDTITTIYTSIVGKYPLSPAQIRTVTSIANTTLLRLEQESALETNIHQMVPELSNEVVRGLVDDIKSRVFAESARREREKILEPDDWDEEAFGPKPSEEERGEQPISDEELDRLAEKEEEEKRALAEALLKLGLGSTPTVTKTTPSNSVPGPTTPSTAPENAPSVPQVLRDAMMKKIQSSESPKTQ
jgi:hypothetical protein